MCVEWEIVALVAGRGIEANTRWPFHGHSQFDHNGTWAIQWYAKEQALSIIMAGFLAYMFHHTVRN